MFGMLTDLCAVLHLTFLLARYEPLLPHNVRWWCYTCQLHTRNITCMCACLLWCAGDMGPDGVHVVFQRVWDKLIGIHEELCAAVAQQASDGVQLGLRAARVLLFREMEVLKFDVE